MSKARSRFGRLCSRRGNPLQKKEFMGNSMRVHHKNINYGRYDKASALGYRRKRRYDSSSTSYDDSRDSCLSCGSSD